MKLKAKRQHLTGNKMRHPGDVFETSDEHAKLLISKGLAEKHVEKKEEKVVEKTKVEKAPKTK